jgi:hypothetical protein
MLSLKVASKAAQVNLDCAAPKNTRLNGKIVPLVARTTDDFPTH